MDKILVVDDEQDNIDLIRAFVDNGRYEIIEAHDGQEAWDILQEQHSEIRVIVLDLMMPIMGGMELIELIRTSIEISKIPIIVQTASSDDNKITEGVKAGIFYYLRKPYKSKVLNSLVESAINHYKGQIALYSRLNEYDKIMSMINECEFAFATLEDANDLTVCVANLFPDPDRVMLGLNEIMINAIEHGNLGITYEEKSTLNESEEDAWLLEVRRRQQLPENIDKRATIRFIKKDDSLAVIISDSGEGFDWREYMDISTERVSDNHGRGIVMAKQLSFDKVEYNSSGNQVSCTVMA